MNILITSVGKRVSLVRKFMKELKGLFCDGKVMTCDMNPEMAPACVISDGCFWVPRCTSDDYIKTLLTLCIENSINIVIPTIDTELAILSANKNVFAKEGIQVLVSDYDFVMTCLDKRMTSKFFPQKHIEVPERRDIHHPQFPMFAKPYDGSSSANTHVIRKQNDLSDEIQNDPKLIFMEYIEESGYKEFTVDMYYGRDNKIGFVSAKQI